MCSRIIRSWIDSKTGERKNKTADGKIWTEGLSLKQAGYYVVGRTNRWNEICQTGSIEISMYMNTGNLQ